MSHEEQIGKSRYTRTDKKDREAIKGKRITAPAEYAGKISHVTNAKGEHHPAIVHVDGSDANPTAHEVLHGFVEFDGRHGFMDV